MLAFTATAIAMLEKNNLEIGAVMCQWLDNVLPITRARAR